MSCARPCPGSWRNSSKPIEKNPNPHVVLPSTCSCSALPPRFPSFPPLPSKAHLLTILQSSPLLSPLRPPLSHQSSPPSASFPWFINFLLSICSTCPDLFYKIKEQQGTEACSHPCFTHPCTELRFHFCLSGSSPHSTLQGELDLGAQHPHFLIHPKRLPLHSTLLHCSR